ncbi:F-box/kelch-repeat protein [Prunus yedoensis var. nudiflora]|uniref:F-box/kelch-repeat protein n=1 Tax=Prunus yedoensis var. nudiflora TaxID=2094558 RepID=A0A314UB36_PRUYE|nr:F-box/kelch-repeat protein [Prunus yedoensis var. nudiflora]
MTNSKSFSCCICRLFPRTSTSEASPQKTTSLAAYALSSRQLKLLLPSIFAAVPPPPSLNNDILVEILSRLPAKSLLRLQCVCKSWRVLISDSHFVMKHLIHAAATCSINNSLTLFVLSTRLYSIVSVGLNNDHVHVANRELDLPVKIPDLLITRIVGSCNGLICLEVNCTNIVIWNPCTGHSKLLPKPSFLFSGFLFFGFGYDSTTDDYKVIRGSRTAISKETVVEVFSLRTNSWRRSRSNKDHGYVCLNGKGCFFNGALYWVELQWAGGPRPIGSRILSFDLAEEKFQETVSLPYLGKEENYVFAGIGVSRNSLFAYSDPMGSDLRIWVLKEYRVRESWAEPIEIYLDQILPEEVDESFLKPLCILESGEVLLDYNRNFLVLYNPKGKTFRSIAIGTQSDVAIYMETLISPATGGGSDM